MKVLLKQGHQLNRQLQCLTCWGALLATLVGCGGSERSDSPLVPPPGRAAAAENAELDKMEPPGTIELPPGEIPSPTLDDAPKPESGIQMPADAVVPTEASKDPSAGAQSDIKYGTWEEIQAVAKSSGRITVVDLWSLACEPCLKEFPGLVKLHQTLGSSVQCIAVDLDYDGRKSRPPEHYQEQVASFLAGVGASGFPTYISRTPSDDVFAEANLASIPAVLIYGADGELVRVFVDAGTTAGFSYEKDVIPLIIKLVG